MLTRDESESRDGSWFLAASRMASQGETGKDITALSLDVMGARTQRTPSVIIKESSAAPPAHLPCPRAEYGHPRRPGDSPPASLPQDWLPSEWAGICHLMGCCGVSITERPSPSRDALRRARITSGVGRAQGCRPVRGEPLSLEGGPGT